MSLRCPYCGEYKVPFGGEAVCGENWCPGPDTTESAECAGCGRLDCHGCDDDEADGA